MKLTDLAEGIGAKLLAGGRDGVSIERVYAGDRISDLLANADDRSLLVSNLAGSSLIRLAELMDLAALCLVDGQEPDAQVLAAARSHGIAVIVSPAGMFETCGRLYRRLPSRSSA